MKYDMSTIYFSVKKTGKKEYKTPMAKVPFTHKSRILWLEATRESLEKLAEKIGEIRAPVWIAIAVPTSWRKTDVGIEYPEEDRELAERIAEIYDGETLKFWEEKIPTIVLPETVRKVNTRCPYCGSEITVEILSLGLKTKPSRCPKCGATIFAEDYESLWETLIDVMNLEMDHEKSRKVEFEKKIRGEVKKVTLTEPAYRDTEIAEEGDHYQGNHIIRVTKKEEEKTVEAVAIQVDPHDTTFQKPELYLVFMRRD